MACEQREVERPGLEGRCLEDLEVGAVEGVEGALDAGPRAGPRGQRREVGRRRAREVGAAAQEVAQLVVRARPDVVGQ